MSIYSDWGYTSNPFKPTPIEPTEKGVELLVGRNKEKKLLKNRLKNDSGIITVEGENGIGKTSVINASIYELYEESLYSRENNQLYIPCNKIFQISAQKDLTEFIHEVYFAIAQTIIEKKNEIEENLNDIGVDKLNSWLNSPMIVNIEAQVMGFGGTYNVSPNETEGFLKSGIKLEIKKLLSTMFPNPEFGGIICVFDNLELLETSKDAKRILEYLRDELLTIPELKWFFSGSHDIFRTFISTPRLSGFIQSPIKISKLHSINIPSILNSRINAYQNHIDNKPYCPILERDFVLLFESLNGNLREVFKRLSSFYLHVYESEREPYTIEEKSKSFSKWSDEDKSLEFDAVKNTLEETEIKLLRLISSQNTTSITDEKLDEIGFENIPTLRTAIDNLENYGLIFIAILESEFMEHGKYKKRLDFFKNIFLSPKSFYIKQLICK